MAFMVTALGLLGVECLGWAVSKGLDVGARRTTRTIKDRLRNGKLDPNHDIERAILRAHWRALQFVIAQGANNGELDLHEPGPGNAQDTLHDKLSRLDQANPQELNSLLTENWRELSAASFPIAISAGDAAGMVRAIPEVYVRAARDEMLALSDWDANEREIVKARMQDPDKGWTVAFSGFLHQEMKDNQPFREIYSQYRLTDLGQGQGDILAALAPLQEMQAAMDRMESVLGRVDTGVARIDKRTEHIDETTQGMATTLDEIRAMLAAQYVADPDAETRRLQMEVQDLQEKQSLTEKQIGNFLKIALPHLTIRDGAVVESLPDLFGLILKEREAWAERHEKPSNDPKDLQDLRAQVGQFLNDFEIDKARAAVRQARAERRDKLEEAARDEASLLAEEARIEAADLNIKAAMDLYEKAALHMEVYDVAAAMVYLNQAGNLGQERSVMSGDRDLLDKARDAFQRALNLCGQGDDLAQPRPGLEHEWAATQNNLGTVYQTLGERGVEGALEQAVRCFENALLERTRDKAPMDWAATQNNLGLVYSTLGERGEAGALEQAVQCFENALLERTRDKAPMDWAATQNNLGNVYLRLGERGKAGALEQAVQCYENALLERTRPKAPMDWAMTQNNLGSVYQTLGEQGVAGALEQAVQCFENALLERTRDKAPMDWAATQNNLGTVYQTLGEQGKAGALEQAVQCDENALQEYTRDKAPMDWAMTQNNLGNVYLRLGERGKAGALEQAVQCYENALLERTRPKAPMDWAMTQNNLGSVYQTLGEQGVAGALEQAVQCFENALLERTRDKAPMDWAATQNNLGTVYQTLGEQGKAGALEQAVQCDENALQEYTRDKAPMDWAMTQNNLGNVYLRLGERGKAGALEQAVQYYENALQEYTRDKAPMDWAMTQNNLGEALWNLERNRQAEICWRRALAVFRALGAAAHSQYVENNMRSCGMDPDGDGSAGH